MSQKTDAIWDKIKCNIVNNMKVFLLKNYAADILKFFYKRIEMMVYVYAKRLPPHVVSSEIDDLRTVAQLELLEALKVWQPDKSEDIWPLAAIRIKGAMKDHIRHITRSDPSRFYEWVTDAAYLYNTVSKRDDFSQQIDTSEQLNHAMRVLPERERKIVIAYIKEDITFKTIGDRFGLSESQVSRIYSKALKQMKVELGKG